MGFKEDVKLCHGIYSVINGACRLVVAVAAAVGDQAEINYLHDYHHLIQVNPENSDAISEQQCY